MKFVDQHYWSATYCRKNSFIRKVGAIFSINTSKWNNHWVKKRKYYKNSECISCCDQQKQKQCLLHFQTITFRAANNKIHEGTCRWVSTIDKFNFSLRVISLTILDCNEKSFENQSFANSALLCQLFIEWANALFSVSFLTDEYIHMRKINKPPQYNRSRCEQSDSGLSKFDRYKHQDDDEDDMDEGKHSLLLSYLLPHF